MSGLDQAEKGGATGAGSATLPRMTKTATTAKSMKAIVAAAAESGGEKCVDHRTVGAFDGRFVHAGPPEPTRQLAKARSAWAMVNRSRWMPPGSTTATAWSVLAQSIPRGRGQPRRLLFGGHVLLVDHELVLPCCLPQQVGIPDGSGHDCRSLTDRRSGGAQPCRRSACPGPLGLAELMQDLRGLAVMAMTQREPGCAGELVVTDTPERAGSTHRPTDLCEVSGHAVPYSPRLDECGVACCLPPDWERVARQWPAGSLDGVVEKS